MNEEDQGDQSDLDADADLVNEKPAPVPLIGDDRRLKSVQSFDRVGRFVVGLGSSRMSGAGILLPLSLMTFSNDNETLGLLRRPINIEGESGKSGALCGLCAVGRTEGEVGRGL